MKFRPCGSYDTHIVQQMIQGTELSCMSFNQVAGHIVFLAEESHNIVGITTGQMVNENGLPTLVMGESYLRHYWDTEDHEREMQVRMMEWAQQKMGATHYKRDFFSAAMPISVQPLIPQEIPVVEQPFTQTVGQNVELAYA